MSVRFPPHSFRSCNRPAPEYRQRGGQPVHEPLDGEDQRQGEQPRWRSSSSCRCSRELTTQRLEAVARRFLDPGGIAQLADDDFVTGLGIRSAASPTPPSASDEVTRGFLARSKGVRRARTRPGTFACTDALPRPTWSRTERSRQRRNITRLTSRNGTTRYTPSAAYRHTKTSPTMIAIAYPISPGSSFRRLLSISASPCLRSRAGSSACAAG